MKATRETAVAWVHGARSVVGRAIREHPAVLVVLVVGVLLRLAVLLTSQRLVDGDEAVVGVMARHVLYHGESSLFFWGQPYGGGAAIEAHLAAALFLLLGPTGIALKLVPLGFTVASWVMGYVLVRRAAGKLPALGATGFLVLAAPALEWSLKARGGYAEIPFFVLLALTLLERIVREGEARPGPCVALGITCGIAYYSQELIVPFLLVLALSLPLLPGRVFLRCPGGLGGVAGGVLLGLAPVVAYNLTHHGANLQYVFARGEAIHAGWARSWNAVTFAIPAFFQPRNVDRYPSDLGVHAVVEASVYGMLLAIAVGSLARRIAGAVRAARAGQARPARRRSRPAAAPARPEHSPPAAPGFGLALETILAAHVLVHVGLFVVSDWSLKSPRYLFPIHASLAILGGMTGARLLEAAASTRSWPAGVASALAVAPPLFGLLAHLSYLKPARVVDDVFRRDRRIINAMVSADSLPRAMELVRAAGIRRVRTTYFTQWRMIFESREEIIASSEGLIPGGVRYPAFDRSVAAEARPAYVIHKESYANDRLSAREDLRRADAGDYWVYVPR